jgi:hypothetical protein
MCHHSFDRLEQLPVNARSVILALLAGIGLRAISTEPESISRLTKPPSTSFGVKSLWLLFLVLTPVFGTLPAERGIPYRLLWHAYQLSLHSSEAKDHLSIVSENGVDPRSFKFTPLSASDLYPLSCDAEGRCIMRWIHEFYTSNRDVYSNQPKGSLNLEFHWSITYNPKLSFAGNVLIYGRLYTEATFHWIFLTQEIAKFSTQ